MRIINKFSVHIISCHFISIFIFIFIFDSHWAISYFITKIYQKVFNNISAIIRDSVVILLEIATYFSLHILYLFCFALNARQLVKFVLSTVI